MDTNILGEFDSFFSRVSTALAENQILLQENRELKAELDTVMRDLELSKKLLCRQNTVVNDKYKETFQNIRKSSVDATETGREFKTQEKYMQAKYDADMLTSAKKMLEREVILQKSENERLQRMNQQLLREKNMSTGSGELEYLRNHCLNLERENANLKNSHTQKDNRLSAGQQSQSANPSQNQTMRTKNTLSTTYTHKK
eukprot:gene5154-10301_t